MKRITLSAFIVLALITIDVTISMAYAKQKTTIYKVSNISTNSKLQLRAWPSPKSRVKVSLPHNAKDLVETGKEKNLGTSKWLQVSWRDNLGWVNSRYLSKTGVLPRPPIHARKASINTASVSRPEKNIASSSRNVKSTRAKVVKRAAPIHRPAVNAMPTMPTENRYGYPAAREVKTTYSAAAASTSSDKILTCVGSSPRTWSITMDMVNKKMRVKSQNRSAFYLPISTHKWLAPNNVHMNIGGTKGRNIVEVNLERTDACSTGLSRKNYAYEVNAAINNDFYSGCCEVAR